MSQFVAFNVSLELVSALASARSCGGKSQRPGQSSRAATELADRVVVLTYRLANRRR